MNSYYQGILRRRDYQEYIRTLSPKKENKMIDPETGFDVEVTQTGIVNGEGRFVPVDAIEAAKADAFVQTGEDVIAD